MLILSIRTDKPDAEIGLFNNDQQLDYEVWPAHRELSSTIHTKIEELLKAHAKTWQDIEGIVCFKGPGSFTGLRIGLSVANALVDGLKIPIVAKTDPRWLENGISDILNGKNDHLALPEYGAPVHITQPKH